MTDNQKLVHDVELVLARFRGTHLRFDDDGEILDDDVYPGPVSTCGDTAAFARMVANVVEVGVFADDPSILATMLINPEHLADVAEDGFVVARAGAFAGLAEGFAMGQGGCCYQPFVERTSALALYAGATVLGVLGHLGGADALAETAEIYRGWLAESVHAGYPEFHLTDDDVALCSGYGLALLRNVSFPCPAPPAEALGLESHGALLDEIPDGVRVFLHGPCTCNVDLDGDDQ